MEYNKAFGAVFRRLRRHRGLTQEAFQPAASDRYIRNLEKGEYSPTLAILRELCELLEVSPITLLSLVEAAHLGLDPIILINGAAEELEELERD